MRSWAARKRRFRRARLASELVQTFGTETTTAPKGRLRLFTPEEARFIEINYRQLGRRALTAALNRQFGNGRSEAQVRHFITNHGLRSGRTGRYEKGSRPWNAGTKGQGLTGPNPGSFQKGNLPHNKRRLWSERINRDGYIEISVPERNPHTGHPTRFRQKHVWLWEVHHGPVPPGHAVAFIDGDRARCVIENLVLISRAELLRLNQYRYREQPEEIKPSVLALAKVEVKAFGLRKKT